MLIFNINKPIKQKQWINTKVEFEWSKELQKYVEISADGYWYEGDMALCAYTTTTDPYTFEGNVGIGTDSPDHELSVIGDIRVGGWTTTDDRKIGKPNGDWAGGSAYLRFVDSDAGSDGDSRKGTAIDIYTHEYNGGTNHCATFDANCNVGIGTDSPAALLHLNGSTNSAVVSRVDNGSTGTGAFSQFLMNGGTASSTIYQLGSGYTTSGRYVQGAMVIDASTTSLVLAASDSTNGVIQFYTDGNNERMRIDNAGNVGIGTTSPGYNLEVAGTFIQPVRQWHIKKI